MRRIAVQAHALAWPAHALIALEPNDGSPAIETDAAARLLFIWGRRPSDPARVTSALRPEDRHHLQSLLAGG